MATVTAKNFTILETLDDKRRKKSEESKPLLLPQKKRVLPHSNTSSPIKKSPKLTSEEGAPEETLIRETEAALKNLSGSWPGHRGGYHQEDAPAFENLFDEKKSGIKMSPISTSNSSSDNACSLKDVITLREQHEHDESSDEKTINPRSKLVPRSGDGKLNKSPKSHYQSPDFNELVDDSSNELEIDMSEAAAEKNESIKIDQEKKKEDPKPKYPSESSSFHAFTRSPTTGSPFSSNSAFRPPQSKNPPLGPFPAEATFVGYPSETSAPEEKSKSIVPLKPTESQVESQVKSPEGTNKQYTILQPAGHSSRAASTLQEVAREGVRSVPAIGGNTSEPSGGKMVAPPGSLSPNSIGRGR